MKFFILVFLFSASSTFACNFKTESTHGTIKKYLENFLKDQKEAKAGTHTFLIDKCADGDSTSHGVYWVEGRSYFSLPWPAKSKKDFQNIGKVQMVTDLNKNLLKNENETPPKNAPIGQYQIIPWAQTFLLAVAQEGLIIQAQK